MKVAKKGKEYEVLIEKLYTKLDPDSTIKRNDKIYGHNSDTHREIDLSIRRTIGLHPVLLIVQARDRSRKIDVNAVAEFKGAIDDVRANGGVLISTKGFTPAAIRLAKKYNIEVLTGHDLNNPKWTIDHKMPVILSSYKGSYSMSAIFEASQDYADLAAQGKIPETPPWQKWMISEDNGKTFISLSEKFNLLCGYDHLQFYDGKDHIAEYNGALQLQVTKDVLTPLRNFKFHYNVIRKLYYKYFDVKEFEGLINQDNYEIGRANVILDSEDFELHNFEVFKKKEIDFSSWFPYDEGVKLIHPYSVRCMSLSFATPPEVTFTPVRQSTAENPDTLG